MKRRLHTLGLALVLLLATTGTIHAADYYQSIESEGLKITIDVWSTSGSAGYIPINIDITNVGPDRTIEITGQRQGYFTYSYSYFGEPRTSVLDVRQAISLKRGDRQRLTIPLPVGADNENVQMQIRERGRILHRFPFSFQTVGVPEFAPALIVANPASAFGVAARDLPRKSVPMPESMGGMFPPGAPGGPPVTAGKGTVDVTREPERLPTNWLGYTTLRAVFIGKQEWEELSAAQKEALLAWTASGGDLSFVDGDWQSLFPDRQRRPTAIGSGGAAERYFLGQFFFPGLTNLASEGLETTLTEMRRAGPNAQRTAFPPDRVINDPDSKGLRTEAEQMRSANNYSAWRLPIPSALDGDSNPMPPQLRGDVSATRGFKLPIPDVGGMSIRVYLAILVLFTLLIGPVNFWVLKRRRQQVFMVLTTPLISIAFIVLLAGYAIAGEGFGISGRAETFTFLDQAAKQAATRASVSLYAAGMAPSGGLRFPKDVAVFPYDAAGPVAASEMSMDLTESQRFTSGLLHPRAPANFSQVAFRTARERLTFTPAGTDIEVVNGLGGTIQQLYYRENGRVFSLREAVAPGAHGKLQRGPGLGLENSIRPGGTPILPLTLVAERADKFQHFFLDSLADGAFYAVLDRSPFWEPGVANVEERASFHVVAGYAGGEP